jgi:hypothetical protein
MHHTTGLRVWMEAGGAYHSSAPARHSASCVSFVLPEASSSPCHATAFDAFEKYFSLSSPKTKNWVNCRIVSNACVMLLRCYAAAAPLCGGPRDWIDLQHC